jgi:hypothetical protein
LVLYKKITGASIPPIPIPHQDNPILSSGSKVIRKAKRFFIYLIYFFGKINHPKIDIGSEVRGKRLQLVD